ncbi:HTH_Tnp_Tc3_2 domain-containing protein [Trichonephila clavipes]|nr:HTH_Tnp_Tc3_2 domain-containing protein [Trichonephila clavipes]
MFFAVVDRDPVKEKLSTTEEGTLKALETALEKGKRICGCVKHPVPSRETIRRRLTEVGLRSRRPLRRLPLTPHHRQCRLDFCRPRATWSVTDWRRVIFSDESRFSLSDDDQRTCLEAHRPAVRSGIYCRAAYSNFTRTATAGSDVVQSGRPIFDDFFQHLWPYIGNNTANVVFQMVKRLWLIRIDQ